MVDAVPIPKVWQEALSWQLSGNDVAPAITVAGASGQCVGQINGIYELRYSSSGDGAPSFQQRDGRDVWLYMAGDMRWWISNAKSKDARASSGWAYSTPVDPGTLPNELDAWGLIQRDGQWEDHKLQVTLSSLEDAAASATEAWSRAALDVAAAPAMIVRGAKGMRSTLVNGAFLLSEPPSDGEAPCFRNSEFDDTWLYFAVDGRWWISSTERKKRREASGWAFSQPVAAGTLPSKCVGWRVTLGDGHFMEQSLQIESCGLEEAETFKATAWSRAVRALRTKQALVVKGASGSNGSYINGIYDLQLDPKGVLAPSFVNRDFDDVSLYYCTDGRWWITRSAAYDFYDPCEPGGWAHSRQAGRGTLPHKVGGWKISLPGGTWKPQNFEVAAKTNDEVDESLALAWRDAFAGVLQKPSIDISGATGDNASLINGTYKLSITGDVGKPPLFRKQGEVDTWLYFAQKGRKWWVSSTKFKDARQPAGWAHSDTVEAGTLPTSVGEWSVFAGSDSWESQALQVVARSSSELVAHVAGAWRKAYSDMIHLPVVEITGASGELGSINGAYELRPSYIDKGTLIFQNRVHEGIWLYPGKDSRWWVSDAKRKDARDAGGWACSEPVELGTPPTSAGGWSVCHGGHRWTSESLKIKAKSLEDVDPLQMAAWKGAVDALQSTPTLRISGAVGDVAASINGMYELQPSLAVGTPPVFRERDDNDRWLYFIPREGSWWIGNTNRKDDCEAKGWARSGRVDPGTLPSAAGDWKASSRGGGGWHAQPQLRVEVVGPGGGSPGVAEEGPLSLAATSGALQPSLKQAALEGQLAQAKVADEAEFILDNSLLEATTLGVRHCLSRSLDDAHETLVTPWDCSVKGVDSGDGWMMCADGCFLPFMLNGKTVLYRKVELDYRLDNNMRKDDSNGMRHRLSRSLDDLHPTAHSFWRSWVRGVDLGDGWLRVSASRTYLPMSVDGTLILIPEAELLHEYVLDNSKLKATTKGMRHRVSMDVENLHPTAHTRWGRRVIGADMGDGWLRDTSNKLYLPMVVDGICVLPRREDWEAEHPPLFEYVADNSELQAGSKGLRHRLSQDMEDVHRTAHTKWGRIVKGADLGDGWLKTADGLFLPLVVNGARVLLTVEEAAAREAARHEAEGAQQEEAVAKAEKEEEVEEAAANDTAQPQVLMAEGDAQDDMTAQEDSKVTDKVTPAAADAVHLDTAAGEAGAVVAEAAQPENVAAEEVATRTETEMLGIATAAEVATGAETQQRGIVPAEEVATGTEAEQVGIVTAEETEVFTEAALLAPRVTADFAPLPEAPAARQDVEPDGGYTYLADNSVLGAATHGIQHRYSANLQDVHPTEGTPWGSFVQGWDTGNGWVRESASGRYVPMTLQGVEVLIRLTESDYRADNSLLQAPTAGVQHRHTKDLKDVVKDDEAARTKWGENVRGVDLGDGWLKLSNGRFVPTALEGVPVLIRKMAVADLVFETLPMMPAIPQPDIVPAPRFGFAR